MATGTIPHAPDASWYENEIARQRREAESGIPTKPASSGRPNLSPTTRLASSQRGRETFLRVFIPHDSPLSDGTSLSRGCVLDVPGCAGVPHSLKIGGRAVALEGVGVSRYEVFAGQQVKFISGAGREHSQTFSEGGIVFDFPVPERLAPAVKRAALARGVGVSAIFKTLAVRGRDVVDAEFHGIDLTMNPREIDEAAQVAFVEV
jgi:hypothetical protein